MIELVAVVAILSLLTMGAVLGLKRQRENTDFNKTLQCLSAVDQAKQTWVMFHPNDTWPTDEPGRWSAVSYYLKSTASIVNASTNGFNVYNGFLPSEKFLMQIDDAMVPSSAEFVGDTGTVPLVRPVR
jgi:type II secretory pathway pseudopilin PulG